MVLDFILLKSFSTFTIHMGAAILNLRPQQHRRCSSKVESIWRRPRNQGKSSIFVTKRACDWVKRSVFSRSVFVHWFQYSFNGIIISLCLFYWCYCQKWEFSKLISSHSRIIIILTLPEWFLNLTFSFDWYPECLYLIISGVTKPLGETYCLAYTINVRFHWPCTTHARVPLRVYNNKP